MQLFGAPPDDVVIIEAIGDSNIPDILPGQRVMIHVNDRTPSPPGYFAIWDGLGVIIKRIEFLMNSDPPTVRIISANPAYKPVEHTLGEIHVLGRVIGDWRRR